jgi:hexosaminidase
MWAATFSLLSSLKKYIDLLANTQVQSFPLALDGRPRMAFGNKEIPQTTRKCACRNETLIGHYNDQPHQFDGEQYSGYYTQEEAREVVKYAADRSITVIPEIDMPGHAMAAVAAYPKLGCTGNQVEPARIWGEHEDIFCSNEATFEFLKKVLTEVMAIFPSKYIHIGGEECPKSQWVASKLCQDIIKKEGLKDENENELQSFLYRG